MAVVCLLSKRLWRRDCRPRQPTIECNCTTVQSYNGYLAEPGKPFALAPSPSLGAPPELDRQGK